jgi:hypothetical protein
MKTHRVVVYGARDHWTPTAEVDTQLWLSHQVREELVEINRAYQRSVRDVWSSRPEIAEVETAVAAVDAQVVELAETAAKERSAARSKRIKTPTTEALAAAKGRRTELRARRRELITAAREDEAVLSALESATHAQRAAEAESYRRYCTAGVTDRDGNTVRMYWANHNVVLKHHQTAVKRINARRAVGQPADLRHHRYDGSGAINIVLQKQTGKPDRTPALLASLGSPWRNVLALDTSVHRGSATFRVASGQSVTVPLTFHRPLPDDCEVIMARLVVRRTAGHRSTQLHITIVEETPEPVADGPAVALHLGWRAEPDGIRVATWRATAPIVVADTVADVVHVDRGGLTGTVQLPARWRDAVTRAEEIASSRAVDLDAISADLVKHLAETAEGDGWPPAADVARWRSPARFAALALRHRDNPPEGREEIVGDLEEWRRWDRRRWETEAHGRAKLSRRRSDAWARVAHWLTGVAGTVVVDDTSVADLSRTPAPSPDSLPTEIERIAVAQRRHAAPGSLRERVKLTAQRVGVPVVEVPHTGTTRTHYACGHVNPADLDYGTRPVTCQGCGVGYDPDSSATANMLAASGHAPRETPGSARGTT